MTRPQTSAPTKIFTATLLPIAAIIAQPAMAAQDLQTSSITIAYDDLRLDSKSGHEKLMTRINSAVKKICDIHATRNSFERRDMQNCKNEAMKTAYRQLDIVMAQQNMGTKLADSRIFIIKK